jgi:hypothetical protein
MTVEVHWRTRQGEDDEDEDKVLEEDNGSGQEEEEDQRPFQEDHVDVTNFLHLLNRIVTTPLSPTPSDTLFGELEK